MSAYGIRAQISNSLDLSCECLEDANDVCIEVFFRIPFSVKDYLLVPGAIYDGNQFAVLDIPYPPIYPFECPQELGPVSTCIPRLPKINLLSGDASYPAVAIWNRESQTGTVLSAPPKMDQGYVGITVESIEGALEVCFQFPGVRSWGKYKMGRTNIASRDSAATIKQGWMLDTKLFAEQVQAHTIPDLFRAVDGIRNICCPQTIPASIRPLSSVADLIQKELVKNRWLEVPGFFRTSDWDDGIPFQVGWVAGGMNTLPMLTSDDLLIRDKAARNIDFICSALQAHSGYFFGGWAGGPVGDGFGHAHAEHWTMVRKNGDMLLFLMRHILLTDGAFPSWETAARECASAFCTTLERNDQIGQFLDIRDGRVVVGGSACAGTAIAGLAIASEYFRELRYLEAATSIANLYASTSIPLGMLNGGPGEILKAPDSEAAFGLVEGLVALAERTADSHWWELAESAAWQAASWVVPYDFAFPEGSSFAELQMSTVGTVIANVQNKHSAPGICTASALPLVRLFRATGRLRWLELAAQISHALPQYVSTSERPIRTEDGRYAPPGYANERVNMSDWESPERGPGEIYWGFCWSATSTLLTALEMPGVYWNPLSQVAVASDHVSVAVTPDGLSITNPTSFDAKVLVMVDGDPSQRLPELWWRDAPRIAIAAGETLRVRPDSSWASLE